MTAKACNGPAGFCGQQQLCCYVIDELTEKADRRLNLFDIGLAICE